MKIVDTKKIILLSIFIIFISSSSHAQLEIPSSLNPVGSGARATGMGGAFIAIADDATAASWNPGGLVQLEKPEISLVGSFFYRGEEYSSSSHPELKGSNSFNHTDLNYLSVAYPFTVLGRNVVVSLNHQMLFDLNKKVNFNYTFENELLKLPSKIFYKQNGELTTLSPAIAFQITPSLSLGATFNFWTNIFGSDGWTTKYRQSSSGTFAGEKTKDIVRIDSRYRFRGFNYHIGTLWNITDKITFGAVYKSSFNAKVNKREKFYSMQVTGNNPPEINDLPLTNEHLRLKMPDSYGIAFAYRFSDNFTMAIDIYRTEWGKYVLEDGNKDKWRAMNLKPRNGTTVKPTHQVRLGGEYLFILSKTVIPVRGGIYYDPEPSTNNPDDYFGISVGSGVSIGPVIIDFAYSYRFGNNAEGAVSGVPNSTIDVKQHLFLLSSIIHF